MIEENSKIARVWAVLRAWPTRAALITIATYQRVLSPLLGPRCRFEPSCSHYTATCIERFGLFSGSLLGVRRICRCHPFHPGGYDPPPAKSPSAGF